MSSILEENSYFQITTGCSESADAVAQFSCNLDRKINNLFKFKSNTIVSPIASKYYSNKVGSYNLARPSADELYRYLNDRKVKFIILHYVGYGYSKKGCPSWLVKGLRHWMRNVEGSKLGIHFHELYATGPFWKSSFWTSGKQKNLTKELAMMADYCTTSTDDYLCKLNKFNKNTKCIPIASCVGERDDIREFARKKNQLVILGSSLKKSWVYNSNNIEQLRTFIRASGVERVIDFGDYCADQNAIAGIKIERQGFTPSNKISEILNDSKYGVLCLPHMFLGKSSIFSALCAHGVVSLLLDKEYHGTSKLFVTENNLDSPIEEHYEIHKNILKHYQNHSLEVHAKNWGQWLKKNQTK